MNQPRFIKIDVDDLQNLGFGFTTSDTISKQELIDVRNSNEDNDTGIEVLLIDLKNMTYYASHGNEWKKLESLKPVF